MRSILSQNGQNIWDIALQYMGSADAVFDILKLNPTLRIDSTIEANTEIFIPDKAVNQRICDYYAAGNIVPATGFSVMPSPYATQFQPGKWINLPSRFWVSIGIFPITVEFDDEWGFYMSNEISIEGAIPNINDAYLLYISGLMCDQNSIIAIGLNHNGWGNIDKIDNSLKFSMAGLTSIKLLSQTGFSFANDNAVCTLIDVIV